jgi:hypothetical protein
MGDNHAKSWEIQLHTTSMLHWYQVTSLYLAMKGNQNPASHSLLNQVRHSARILPKNIKYLYKQWIPPSVDNQPWLSFLQHSCIFTRMKELLYLFSLIITAITITVNAAPTVISVKGRVPSTRNELDVRTVRVHRYPLFHNVTKFTPF